uniref:Glyoxalase/bleomycin resistance/dioxygenase family protein n=1 Tax=Roseihalotalea indica TaxID=2867963 RepID=A0AA49JJ22_9BACT|nr:glyoxalase/bleomycin resistance/dioxygenase family protein [Tunicatimonas sp. TK19036]
MKTSKVKGLTGLIMSSADPEKLATFYKDVLGLPLQLNKHGNLPAHWECDFGRIHYAILKQRNAGHPSGNVVPSFEVDNITEFVKQHDLAMLHPLIDLGNGSFVGSINDPDGNVVRLWMNRSLGEN